MVATKSEAVVLELVVEFVKVVTKLYGSGVDNNVNSYTKVGVTGSPMLTHMSIPGPLYLQKGDNIRAYFGSVEPAFNVFGLGFGSKSHVPSDGDFPLKLEKIVGGAVVAEYHFPRASQLTNY